MTAVEVDAAGAAARRIGIGDRLGAQQCLLESVRAADVGLRYALAHTDANADPREYRCAPCGKRP
jgi:hypothetical protein